MKQAITILLVVILAGSVFAVDFKVNGVYTAWLQSQNEFTLNKDANYNDNYAVQMLRFKVQGIANENLKLVTRFDLAQGWWGVDNALRSINRPYGKYGGSSLFDYKDTNFLFHVDQAYVDFNIPETPLGMRVGRMWYGLGNKIILDNNFDGIQVDLKGVIGKKITLGWAKVSEGADNTNDLQVGTMDNRDADLYTLNVNGGDADGNLTYDAFAMYYNDQSVKDMDAYIPNELQYFKTRFSPQVTQLTDVGVAGKYKADQFTVNGEFNYLTGKDDIDNVVTDSTGARVFDSNQLVDVNDGDLSGYNLYIKGNYAASDKLSVGAVFGMGSGDDDPTGGAGNVNKLRTSGFFYVTEIWEDSIMPDEEGITPQGLGAPNVRAYRELENTTILQLNGNIKLFPKFSAFLSYSYIMASNDIYAWSKVDEDGDGSADFTVMDLNNSATDLGQEIDFKFTYKMYDELALILRGGYFLPGDAAGYLINGNTNALDTAYEFKGMVLYKF